VEFLSIFLNVKPYIEDILATVVLPRADVWDKSTLASADFFR